MCHGAPPQFFVVEKLLFCAYIMQLRYLIPSAPGAARVVVTPLFSRSVYALILYTHIFHGIYAFNTYDIISRRLLALRDTNRVCSIIIRARQTVFYLPKFRRTFFDRIAKRFTVLRSYYLASKGIYNSHEDFFFLYCTLFR